MRRARSVLNGQGLPVTQDEYNALMRSVANLSALVVHLEDKLDELRAQAPTPPELDHKGSESAQSALDGEGRAEAISP